MLLAHVIVPALFGVLLGPGPAPAAATQSIVLSYDANGRLTRAVYDGSVEVTYLYDASGNILRRAVRRVRPVSSHFERFEPRRASLLAPPLLADAAISRVTSDVPGSATRTDSPSRSASSSATVRRRTRRATDSCHPG